MSVGDWRVVVVNDDVNPLEGVVYALCGLVGLPVGDALYQALLAHERGSAVVARLADRHAAELLTARLQVCGLAAVMRDD